MKVRFFRPLSIILLLVTFASCSKESPDQTTPASNSNYVVNNNYTYSEIELQIADLINQYRVSQGLPSLEKINHI